VDNSEKLGRTAEKLQKALFSFTPHMGICFKTSPGIEDTKNMPSTLPYE
jgi:hypothetical protein